MDAKTPKRLREDDPGYAGRGAPTPRISSQKPENAVDMQPTPTIAAQAPVNPTPQHEVAAKVVPHAIQKVRLDATAANNTKMTPVEADPAQQPVSVQTREAQVTAAAAESAGTTTATPAPELNAAPAPVQPQLVAVHPAPFGAKKEVQPHVIPTPVAQSQPPQQAPAPVAQQQQQQQQQQGAATAASNKLKVEDALSYLDKVKLKFAKMPQVYNDFLDIMKEFKSQGIDTPGVIHRVSELFEGHPDLITGFNTFLPPGFKIEAPENGMPGQYRVTITETRGGENMVTEHIVGRNVGSTPYGMQQVQYANQQQQIHAQQQAHIQQQQQQQLQAQQQQQQQAAAQQQQASGEVKTGPLEFNHAIQYVNKIKQRFINDQQVYKDFLEILHTYQKEQKSIRDVYFEVKKLFRKEPDLLEEFAQFLPEAGPEHQMAQTQQEQQTARQGHRYQPRATKAAKSSKKDIYEMADKMAQYPDLYIKELEMFDKIKRILKPEGADASVYDNFLRCLNLYSHDIVKEEELVGLVAAFLGNHDELMAWFKNFVGFVDRDPLPAAPVVEPPQAELDLRTCKQLDKSYRQLPEMQQGGLCSGRELLDDVIKIVLNDTWVSFATRSDDPQDEGQAFPPSKKNVHEEAIFRCEDERFELDIVLEANLATIAVLDTTVKKLQKMSPEALSKYKFNKATLGGSSRIIHYRAVERLYGERAVEVVDALERDPLNNIPLVLKRLQQKHTEWRGIQRHWNHVWRELNEKHYLRSLDYQSSNFKKVDQRNNMPKTLKENILEEQMARREWRKKKIAVGERTVGDDGPPVPIVSFEYDDLDILEDIKRLLCHSAKPEEVEQISAVLDLFFPKLLFLDVPAGMDDTALVEKLKAAGADKDLSDEASNDSESVSWGSVEGGNSTAEGVAGTTAEAFTVTADATATGTDAGEDAMGTAADGKIMVAATGVGAVPLNVKVDTNPQSGLQRVTAGGHLFIANMHWYQLFKLHQILYSRLNEVKKIANQLLAAEDGRQAGCKAQVSASIALALKAPLEVGVDEYYAEFVRLVEKLIDGSMDSSAFEETCREMFNVHAYRAFTVDRLVVNLKVWITKAVTNGTSMACVGLYFRSQADSSFDYVSRAYRQLADKEVFAIECRSKSKLDMELLDFHIAEGDDDSKTATENWLEYVHKFSSAESTDVSFTEAIKKHPVFLRRNKQEAGFTGEKADEALKDVELASTLECKICVSTYKMFFRVNGEDYFHRRCAPAATAEHSARSTRYNGFLNKWADRHITSQDREQCRSWLDGPAVDKPVEDAETGEWDAAAGETAVGETSGVMGTSMVVA